MGIRGTLLVVGLAALSALAPASAAAASCGNQAARSGASASLPDCRAYDMISAANGEDGEVYIPRTGNFDVSSVFSSLPFQASSAGDAVTYLGAPSASAGAGSVEPTSVRSLISKTGKFAGISMSRKSAAS